jgi:hypothetical protein
MAESTEITVSRSAKRMIRGLIVFGRGVSLSVVVEGKSSADWTLSVLGM